MQRRRRLALLPALATAIVVLMASACGPKTPAAPAGQPAQSVPSAAPAADPRPGITVLGAGDILPHPEMWRQAMRDGHGTYDFYPMLAGVASTISAADLALCHLEPVLSTPTGPFEGFPTFNVPPQVLDATKRVGFDGCSTSSNHALDHGEEGVVRTIDSLDAIGLGHTGTYKSAADAVIPKIYTVKGVKLAHLSYAKHFNGFNPPDGKPWIANRIDVNQILAAAKAARQAGAQIVVLSMHWGTEYQHEPDTDQQTWANAVIQSPDIDIIFGHHAHVVQPVEVINGKWVVYGMGNQVARHAEPIDPNREGVMIQARFTEVAPGKWQVTELKAIPLWVDLNPEIRLIELPTALSAPGTPPGKRAIFGAALERIKDHLTARGADLAGLVVVGTT